MRSSILALLVGIAGLAKAAVIRSKDNKNIIEMDGSSGSLGVAVYLGIENNERGLAEYCQNGEGIDILVLDFLSPFGGGTYPNTGQSCIGGCFVDSTGNLSGDCNNVGNDITICQKGGKKFFLRVGGDGDADEIAYALWNGYAYPSVTDNTSPRQFGNAVVNGWNSDIESNPDNSDQHFGELMNKLRAYFWTDEPREYYILGAPTVSLPVRRPGLSHEREHPRYSVRLSLDSVLQQ